MMVAKYVSAAALFTVLTASAAFAQTGRTPAELPPASYSETQYVDSAGCVFIRAGFNGATTWVPRFGDDRRPMCGFTPSLQGGTTSLAAAAPAPVTVRTVAAAPTPRRTAPVAAAPRATQPVQTAPAMVATGPSARIYQAQSGGALDRRWSFADVTGPSPCTNYSALSQLYAVPSPVEPGLPLRCGPQAVHPADALREQSPNGGRWVPWTGVLPAPDNNVYILPPAYAPRWPEPYLQGASAAPRAMQPAIGGHVGPTAHVSTMGTTQGVNAAPPRQPGRMSNGQYVQVGSYSVESNARATIARLQSSGMPVAMGRATQGSQPVQVVLAGPFTSQGELQAALNRARSMGYGDAFIR